MDALVQSLRQLRRFQHLPLRLRRLKHHHPTTLPPSCKRSDKDFPFVSLVTVSGRERITVGEFRQILNRGFV